MAALLLLGPRLLPEYRDPDAGRIDLISVVLSLTAILSLIFGLKQTAQDGPTPLALGSIAVGLVVGVAWVRRQLSSADPMFDLSLFRIPRFATSLAINFLAIFLAIGFFLFVAQYMQLVLGLTPLEAGLWSLPEAVGFILGPNLAPRIVRHIRPAYLMAGGFLLAGAGLLLLSTITASSPNGLALVVISSAIIALGLGPVFGLTTELIVGSAPPERAGAATGMSETGSEVGGALGLSVLGLIGVAIYRSRIAEELPAGVPADVAAAARDTLGAAVEVAATLPPAAGEALLRSAQSAFVEGMQVACLISVVVSVVVAVDHVRRAAARPADQGEAAGHGTGDRAGDRALRGTGGRPARGGLACARIVNMSVRFRTTIQQNGKTALGFEVPPAAVEALGAGKRPPVTVTINGYSYRNTVAVMGGASMIGVSAEHRGPAKVTGGEEVDVELALDTAPREVTVPPELQAALDADPAAGATFDKLSYSNKSWHALQVTGTNNPETRARRVEKSIAALREGRVR